MVEIGLLDEVSGGALYVDRQYFKISTDGKRIR